MRVRLDESIPEERVVVFPSGPSGVAREEHVASEISDGFVGRGSERTDDVRGQSVALDQTGGYDVGVKLIHVAPSLASLEKS